METLKPNCLWEEKEEIKRDCGTCKYELLNIYDMPCSSCNYRKEFGGSNWEPKEETTTDVDSDE